MYNKNKNELKNLQRFRINILKIIYDGWSIYFNEYNHLISFHRIVNNGYLYLINVFPFHLTKSTYYC